MRKARLLATSVVAAAALLAVFATNSYAYSGSTAPCVGCHSGAGVTVFATPAGTIAGKYDVAVTGGTAWAVFDSTTRVAGGLGTTGQFTVPVGKMYNVFAVKGPLTTDGFDKTTVSPAAPPSSGVDTSTPDTTATVTTSDAHDSYVGNATIHITATDNLGGWGVAYIYSRIEGKPIALTRVLAGIRTGTSSFTLAAPASGSTIYRVSFWAQDNFGNVELRNFKTITVAALATPVTPGLTPVYRFFRPSTGTHLYTADATEMARIRDTMGSIYHLEGVAYNVSSTTGTPVVRFFSPSKGVHFYSADPAEIASVRANLTNIWSYEGVSYYIGQ